MKNGKELDKKILNVIREHGAITRKEIQKELGYTNLYGRLRRMIRDGKIKFVQHDNKTHVYYIEDEGLIKWISNLPDNEQVNVLIRSGLIDKNELRKKARQQGVSMKELAKEFIEEKLWILNEGEKWNRLFGWLE